MNRKTRLGKAKRLNKKDRMLRLKDPYGDYDKDGVKNMDDCKPQDPNKHSLDPFKIDVEKAQQDVKDITESLAGFFTETSDIEVPEDMYMQKNLKIARNLIKSHPEGNIMLKVELDEEPVQGAGRIVLIRAEDFVNFDEIEAEDVDSGSVYTTKRANVKKIIGRVMMDSSPEFPKTSTTLGQPMRMTTDMDMQPTDQTIPQN
jgi:hypothetical protein